MWVRVDDMFPDHAKVAIAGARLGPYGTGRVIAVWMSLLCYVNHHETGGFVPDEIVRTWRHDRKPIQVAEALAAPLTETEAARYNLEVGQPCLWVKVDGGYRFHDYAVYQPNAEDLEALRLAKVEAGRKGGQASADRRRLKRREADLQAAATKQSQAAASAHAQAESNPVPVPDPGTSKTESTSSKHPPPARGGPTLIAAMNPNFVNRGPVGLWRWQFDKFANALVPTHGDQAAEALRAWVLGIDARAFDGEWNTAGKESEWWQARFDAVFGAPTASTAKTAGNADAVRRFVARGQV